MTTHRKYDCNLCRATINETTGVGIYWEGAPRGIVFRLYNDAESHLCNACITGIIAEMDRMDKHEKAKCA